MLKEMPLVKVLLVVSLVLCAKAATATERLPKFNLHVPDSVKRSQKPVPLFVVLHGGLTNWLFVRLDSGFCKRADRDEFIVAFPQGDFLTWNAGRCCGPSLWNRKEDVESINRLIENLKERYPIDADRVYLVGSSNGAMLAQKVAREKPEQIAAFASVAGCLYPGKEESSHPVSAFLINGDNDKVVRFNGGRGGLPIYRFDSTPASLSLTYWVERNGCTSLQEMETTDFEMKCYTGGKENTEVLYYKVKNGTHTWPGGLHARIAGSSGDKQLNATDLICDFCLRHKRESQQTKDTAPSGL